MVQSDAKERDTSFEPADAFIDDTARLHAGLGADPARLARELQRVRRIERAGRPSIMMPPFRYTA
jgi:hypothetical protein